MGKKSVVNAVDTKHQVTVSCMAKVAMQMEDSDKDSRVEEEEFQARTPVAAKAEVSQQGGQKASRNVNAEVCIACISGGKLTCKSLRQANAICENHKHHRHNHERAGATSGTRKKLRSQRQRPSGNACT